MTAPVRWTRLTATSCGGPSGVQTGQSVPHAERGPGVGHVGAAIDHHVEIDGTSPHGRDHAA